MAATATADEVDELGRLGRSPCATGKARPTLPRFQAAVQARARAWMYRSRMARRKRPMQTPTVAPAPEGCQDANQRTAVRGKAEEGHSRSPPIEPCMYIFMPGMEWSMPSMPDMPVEGVSALWSMPSWRGKNIWCEL
jgi:hypothetical protein